MPIGNAEKPTRIDTTPIVCCARQVRVGTRRVKATWVVRLSWTMAAARSIRSVSRRPIKIVSRITWPYLRASTSSPIGSRGLFRPIRALFQIILLHILFKQALPNSI